MSRNLYRPLIASLLFALVLTISAPAEVYLANIDEMSYGLNYHAQDALVFFAVIFGVLAAIIVLLLFLDKRLLRALEVLLIVGLLLLLVNRNLLYGDYGAFDGRGLDIAPASPLSIIQLAIAAILFLLAWKKQRLAGILLPIIGLYALLTLGITANNFYSSGAHWKMLFKHPSPLGERYFQFSQYEPNYLYIILDEIYGDSAREILESDPELSAAFTGFTLYADTAGTYPTTIVSVPAILSGELYQNGEAVKEYLSRAFSSSPLLRGLESRKLPAYVHSSGMYCNHLDRKTCSDMGDMLPSRNAAASEYGEILDVTLFSMLPDLLKPLLYDRGNWTFRKKFEPLSDYSPESFQVREFKYFVQAIQAKRTSGSFKLFHNTVTHSPVRHNRECESLRDNLPTTYENYLEQDRCGFKLVRQLLERLRELEVYDNTFIIISSDHGRPFLPDNRQDDFDNSASGASYKQYGYAHATLLVKPLEASNDLRISSEPASLLDIGHFLTRAIENGGTELGSPESAGKRPFHYYDWSKKYFDWKQAVLPPFQAVYTIGPGIREPESWRENEEAMRSVLRHELQDPLKCGSALNLSRNADQAYYMSDGLAGVESWGRWSDGANVRIHFLGQDSACGQQRIALDLKAFLRKNRPRQFAEVYFNGTRIGTVEFHREGSQDGKFDLTFSESNYKNNDINTIEFRIDDPVSPAQLGANDDPRKLAIGIKSITVY